eukprot:CAMPEP_0201590400 /NCGR_PEP_ID=MMETSP0190_2-20130828/177337_1 /ASSEMBLY_ACC=CAM_ASM_000263 /TAXON_ID=37353 /ORGANISM="Rosalina sp." /LENGTH=327 /DNA_ID=CAMNT_0048046467 /DNA_START=278 /DNA_END=1261 /DNA_ORIENTATION=-
MNSQRLYKDGEQRSETDVAVSRQNSLSIRELTLYDCLENEYGFHAFLCHAYKEFSVENVLAVVELQQFQNCYQGKKRDKRLSVAMNNNDNDSKDKTSIRHNIEIEMETVTISSHSKPRLDTPVELKSVASESLSKYGQQNSVSHDDICGEEEENKQESTTSKLSESSTTMSGKRRSRKRKNRGSRLARLTSIEDLFNVQMQNHTFSLPKNLPNSSIVYDNTLSMREKIIQLLDKYVVTGGEFELNLGSSQRTELLNKKHEIDSIDDDECASIFNATIYAIIALMHDSFIRFQQTNNYFQLREELIGKDEQNNNHQNSHNDNKTESLL